MNVNIDFDSKTLESFLTLSIQGFKKSAIELEKSANQVGDIIANLIVEAITLRHPIGSFMGPRTKVTVVGDKGTVVIQVGGIPEPSNGVFQYNLWEAHEYGYNTGDIVDKFMAWDNPKGSGNNWTVATSRKGQEVTRYKGEVEKILIQMRPEITLTLKSLVDRAAIKQVETVIKGASGGKIKPKISMQSLGVTPQMGIVSIDVVYPSMKINYHGAGGKFVAATKVGLPTTAKGMSINMSKKNIKITK